MGEMQQIIKLGWGIAAEIAAPIGIENEANHSSTPNPNTHPSYPKLKAGLRGHRMGGITNHPSPLLSVRFWKAATC